MTHSFAYEMVSMTDKGFTHLGFNSFETAIKHCTSAWESLTDAEKNQQIDFILIECMDRRTDSANHLDGKIVARWR